VKKPIFAGSGVAVITPFTKEGIDFPALEQLLAFQIANETDAVIVCGTTGEASTMTGAERTAVVKKTVEMVAGKMPVIVGTGSNHTDAAIRQSREAEEAGADGVLVVTPYYNKATQTGLIRHYTAVADAVGIPLITYDVPSRTGVTIAPETYAVLSGHPKIIGTKEASGNFAQIQKTRELCGEEFYIWSGNDEDTAAVCLLGGKGVISVAANVIPREMHQLVHACMENDYAYAGKLQLRYRKLIDLLFCEVNPIPVKTALHMMGFCEEVFRLPLCELKAENRMRLQETLQEYELL